MAVRDTYGWYTDVQALGTLPIGYLTALGYRMQRRSDTEPFRDAIDRAVQEQRSRIVVSMIVEEIRTGGRFGSLLRREVLQEICDPGLAPLIDALSLGGFIAAYFVDPTVDLTELFEEARLRQMINCVPTSVPRLAENFCGMPLSCPQRSAVTPEARHGLLLAQACIRSLLEVSDRRPKLLIRQKDTDPLPLLEAQGLANTIVVSAEPLTLQQKAALCRHLRLGQEVLSRAGLTELSCQLAIYRMLFLE
jgi:hypothetical protein